MKRIPHWLIITMIAAAARLINLAQESLWYDETFTAWVAGFDLRQLFDVVRGDVHPPLYYLIQWVNVRLLGNSEFALRLPSAILGIVASLLLWRIALDLKFPRNTALYAGILAATMPAAIYYGQEARMYTLLTCFVFLMVLGAIRHSWLMVIVGGVGAVYSQNLGVFYVAAIGLSLVAQSQFRNRAIIACIAIFILWIPQGLVLIEQARSVAGSFWTAPMSLGGTLWPLNGMVLGWRLPSWLQWPAYGAGFGGSLVGLINSRRWLISRDGLIVVAAMITAPALCILVSVLWKPIFLPRAFLPSTTLVMLLWAYALNHLSAPNRAAYARVVLPALAVAIAAHYFPVQPRAVAREVAHIIDQRWQAGDVIYYTAADSPLAFNYYLHKPYLMSEQAGDRNKSIERLAYQYLNTGDLPTALATANNVFIIITVTQLTSQSSLDEIAALPVTDGQQIFQDTREVFEMRVYRIPGALWRQSAQR